MRSVLPTRRTRAASVDDQHLVADADFVVESDHFAIGQQHAAGALGLADAVFSVGAVYVYVACVGIDDAAIGVGALIHARFEAAQP
jgi:hypothetical protein